MLALLIVIFVLGIFIVGIGRAITLMILPESESTRTLWRAFPLAISISWAMTPFSRPDSLAASFLFGSRDRLRE